jgi:hydroxymethylglutaryl-CoA reductase
MKLHARNLAKSAGATEDEIDQVAQAMIDAGTIRMDKAEEIIKDLRS